MIKTPFFTISLDFELLWGIFSEASLETYGANILGGRNSIPKILSLFKSYKIHATWGVVAMASFENKKELMNFLPDIKPNYVNYNVDPYRYLNNVGENESEDPYHFGYSLLRQITDVEGMEIGSHTFSHFYCLEEHNEGAFKADLEAASASFERLDIDTKSLIFCRNQYSEKHLNVARDAGFTAYRGNEDHYLHRPRRKHALPVRAARLADAYVNISGNHLSTPNATLKGLVNIPSSRFLRPTLNNKYLENLRLNRIKSSMLEAAQKNKGFHLWWHPHNFGKDPLENIGFLTNILTYYEFLSGKYGMQSLSMSEISAGIIESGGN